MKTLYAAAVLFLMFASLGFAQTTQKQGFSINPNFVGPAQFVSTKSNGWVLLPTAGLSVSAEWQDLQTVTANGISTQSVLWSAGLAFEENFGEAANAQTVNNAVLGIVGDWKGYTGIFGVQVMGPQLGGSGSNGLVVGVSYRL